MFAQHHPAARSSIEVAPEPQVGKPMDLGEQLAGQLPADPDEHQRKVLASLPSIVTKNNIQRIRAVNL